MDAPEPFTGRELMLLGGAMSTMLRYHLRLAEKNVEPEAKIKNVRNTHEARLLIDKIEAHAKALRPVQSTEGGT